MAGLVGTDELDIAATVASTRLKAHLPGGHFFGRRTSQNAVKRKFVTGESLSRLRPIAIRRSARGIGAGQSEGTRLRSCDGKARPVWGGADVKPKEREDTPYRPGSDPMLLRMPAHLPNGTSFCERHAIKAWANFAEFTFRDCMKRVEDGIEDFTERVGSGASVSFGGGHVGFYVFPFGIG